MPWRASRSPTSSPSGRTPTDTSIKPSCAGLERYADRPLKIGSFWRRKQCHQVVSDTYGIAALLHEHGALSFWDFAACAPYVSIEMTAPAGATRRPTGDGLHLAAQVHRRTGHPGVLAVRRQFSPTGCRPTGRRHGHVRQSGRKHRYLTDPTPRGGTPAIVEAFRAGLVFNSREAVGIDVIRRRETTLLRAPSRPGRPAPAISILGNLGADRLSIVSFVVRGPSGKYLHHNFVVALLKSTSSASRPGAAARCAGPYGHCLLDIDLERSHLFEQIATGCRASSPGGYA